MKILFVIDSLRMGGAEKSLVTLLGLIPRKGVEIEVMRTVDGGELQPLIPDWISLTLMPMKSPGLMGRLRYDTMRAVMHYWRKQIGTSAHPNDFFWRFMRHAVPRLKGHYDVAVAYQQGMPTAYVATRVSASRKIAWVNADVASAGYNIETNLYYYRQLSHIVTVSDTLRTLFLQAFPSMSDKVSVIKDIINPEQIRTLADRYVPYPSIRSGLRILTVARLERIKGIDLAVEAAGLLRDAGLDFHWHIIGDGNERRAIETLISRHSLADHITLLGTVSNPYPWMKGCDIYVQPSRHEGYGIAIAEAMTLCRPVITTDFPVAHDHIDGSDGIIAPTSAQGIADAVTRLAAPAARRAITDTLRTRHRLKENTDLHKALTLLLK